MAAIEVALGQEDASTIVAAAVGRGGVNPGSDSPEACRSSVCARTGSRSAIEDKCLHKTSWEKVPAAARAFNSAWLLPSHP